MPKLVDLAMGQGAKVLGIEGDGAVTRRILEMGLTPGVAIRLVGKAPWGDPLEYEVRNYRLSLRKSEAALVSVALDD